VYLTTIRNFQESDAESVGRLIADTYSHFNLSFLPFEQQGLFLGPFRYASSQEQSHREAISRVVKSAVLLVAEDNGEIVGVLRGRLDRLASLFVRGDHHRQGIGRKLVEHFEAAVQQEGATVIRVASTLFAVPFYLAVGYKRSTGIRKGWSFEGRGLEVQPMRKVLRKT
jgi:predicted N-acetyltransferase YhbS